LPAAGDRALSPVDRPEEEEERPRLTEAVGEEKERPEERLEGQGV